MKRNFLLLFMLVFTIGCAPQYIDLRDRIVSKEISLPPYFFYYDLVSISDSLLAFAYRPAYEITQNGRIAIYDLDSSRMIDIPMPRATPNCPTKWVSGNLALIPNGNLAFNTVCYSDPLGGPQLLMEYDIKRQETKQLFDFGNQMSATHSTFLSTQEFLQENAIGYPMSDELFRISLADQSETQLVPNFLRAARPSWSAKDKLVAFWGTAQFPGTKPTGLYTSEDISRLVAYPWDLYTMDSAGNKIQKIFPSVDNAGVLSWSPGGNLLAFGGTIQGVDGIWLLNLQGGKPIRIFDHNDLFGWSPGGKEIAVIGIKEDSISNNNVPVKAHFLKLPICIFDNNCK